MVIIYNAFFNAGYEKQEFLILLSDCGPSGNCIAANSVSFSVY